MKRSLLPALYLGLALLVFTPSLFSSFPGREINGEGPAAAAPDTSRAAPDKQQFEKVTAAMGKTAMIRLRWGGQDTVKLQIGAQTFHFVPLEEMSIMIPTEEALRVRVIKGANTYTADEFLRYQKVVGTVVVDLDIEKVILKYNSKLDQLSSFSDIWSNQVLVYGDAFLMGSDNGYQDEKPVHMVRLMSFYISKYEVTQEQWEAVMGKNPSFFRSCHNCPVENVSWDEAMQFINKLNGMTGKHYRLPTEAEWEFAARGGHDGGWFLYSGSNEIDDVGWCTSNSHKQTHPVGQKLPNQIGLYDMTGNVSEWCSDWYSEEYYKSSPNFNPKGPQSSNWHVIRGGSWYDFDVESRSIYRKYPSLDYKMYMIGFRLARDL